MIVGTGRAPGESSLERRLAALRARRGADPPGDPGDDAGRRAAREEAGDDRRARSAVRAGTLAQAVGGEGIATPAGTYVRVAGIGRPMPLDRDALARLPGQPPPDVPLVCLDTETTGLATAAGTFVFLVGLGTWRGDRFEQEQLLLPDHADEAAFLAALRDRIPPDGWLVTYNGRGFDWPLLVTRFRMGRGGPPPHGGHLDLLPFVRRVFRHRLPDARLRTVERELLDTRRHGDVEGWEIPGRYLAFLRDGRADGLVEVVRHNDQDVRSLANLLIHVASTFGDPGALRGADTGDLAELARLFSRARRDADALELLDAALTGAAADALGAADVAAHAEAAGAHAGARAGAHTTAHGPTAVMPGPTSARRREETLGAERARTLRRLGRFDEALAAWDGIAGAGGPLSGVAWIEAAKLHEHRRRDPESALAAAVAALAIADRARDLGRPLPHIEDDLRPRIRRLRRRLARRGLARSAGAPPRVPAPRGGPAPRA